MPISAPILDDEEFEKSKAMLMFMTELVKGFDSGNKNGWLSEDDVDRYSAAKRQELRNAMSREDE